METTEIVGDPRRLIRPRSDRWLGGVAAGLGAYFDLSPTTSAHIWPSPGNLWVAVALFIAAIAWWHSGAVTPGRRRIVVASLLAPFALAVVGLVLAVRVPLFAGIGSRSDAPAVAQDNHSKYTLGVGKLELDFSSVQLPKGETFVKATVGIGDLRVAVPQDATVDVVGRAQAGDVRLLGQDDNGLHVRSHVVDRTGSGRVIVLDLRTGLGQVSVTRW